MSATEQFVENPKLTAIAISYRNDDVSLIADEVLPRTPTARKFSFKTYDDAQSFTVPNTLVGRRGTPNVIEMTGSDQERAVNAYAIDVPVDNVTYEEGLKEKVNYRGQAIELATDIVALDREIRVAALVTDPTNYYADLKTALSGSDVFSNPLSDPVGLIEHYLNECWMKPNQLTFSHEAWMAFRKHPKVVKSAHANSGDEGRATRKQVAELLEVKRIIVGDSRVNVKRPGKEAELTRTWGDSVSGQYINKAASTVGGVTFGFTAVHGKKVAGTLKANMGLRGGVYCRSGEEVSEEIVAWRTGFLISAAAAG